MTNLIYFLVGLAALAGAVVFLYATGRLYMRLFPRVFAHQFRTDSPLEAGFFGNFVLGVLVFVCILMGDCILHFLGR